MRDKRRRKPLLHSVYQQYLVDQDSAAFIKKATQRYTLGTLERLAAAGARVSRRAAVLALGFVGEYDCNKTLGRALCDADRGVRTLAENAIRSIWSRAGNDMQRQLLAIVVRLNVSRQFDLAVVRATELIEEAPWYAEAWNQRAIGHYGAKQYAASIDDCHQALELNPYHFAAAAGMGQCRLKLGDTAGALEAFRRALALNPDMEGVRASVARLERAIDGRS